MARLARLSLLILFLALAAPAANAQSRTDGDPLPEGARFRFGSIRFRHPGGIRSSALSADGKLLATTSGRSVIVWELQAGQLLRRFAAPDGSAFSSPGISFSPDGKRLGYTHGYTFACVWDLATGKELLRLDGKVQHPRAVAHFTPGGKEFITSDNEHIRFWDLATGKEARSVKGTSAHLLSPNAAIFVQVDEKALTRLGDPRTGKVLHELQVPAADNGGENGLEFTPDSKWLAIVHMNKAVELRDTATWELRASFPLPALAFRKDGRYPDDYRVGLTRDAKQVFLGMSKGTLHRWDVASGKELVPFQMPGGRFGGIHHLPESNTLVTTAADGMIRRWDLKSGEELSPPDGYVGRTQSAFSADGRLVAIGDERGRVDLWDANTGKRHKTLRSRGSAVRQVSFGPGEVLAIADTEAIRLLRLTSANKPETFAEKLKLKLEAITLLFSPDGSYFAANRAVSGFRLWERPTGMLVWRANPLQCPVFSSDGLLLATGSANASIFVLDAATGTVRSELSVRHEPAALAFAPDGKVLAAALGDKIVLLNLANGRELQRFTAVDAIPQRFGFGMDANPHRVRALAFSPDGRLLLSGGSDTGVRVWELATGKEVLRRDGHEGGIDQVAFAPNGRTAFSSADDSLAYIWELRPNGVTKKPLETVWEELAGEPETAYRAVWALVNNPRAAADLVRKNIAPVAPVPKERLASLIADLNSESFKTRATAAKTLAGLGNRAKAALESALKNPPSVEVRQRLKNLLDSLEREPAPPELRHLRAVHALELAGTAEAMAVLRIWAGGAVGARLTEDSRASLKRLKK
jgi:WD40 repeat protein